ncbi:MAG TPA: DinB family protein [Candidatus Dormibacteraeota bacterium]|nr:DinB family protein [Candidatus Dormibacteraeota bacterium]
MPELTATLESILAAFGAAETEAKELAEGLSSAQANWQPNNGHSWSICQCLDHLAKTNSVYAAALQEAVSNSAARYKQPTLKIVPGFFGRWFVQSMEAPARGKFKAPSKILPAQKGHAAELLEAFMESHEELRTVVKGADSVDINRLRFKNPFIGVIHFTVGTGLMVINAHDRRHLWQAEQVKKAAGYPAQ